MTDIAIQRLGTTDVDLAEQLCRAFTLFQRDEGIAELPVPPVAHLRRLLEKENFHALVAVQDGMVVGGLTAYELTMFPQQATELFVYDVAVEASYRRQGVGTALITYVRQLCRTRGIACFYVAALAEEADAVRFYEATGLQRDNVVWFTQEFDDIS